MTFLYVNFSEGNSFITVTAAVWALIGGIIAGSVISLYSKAYLGRLVRRLIKKEACGEESAVTLESLGVGASPLMRYSLRDNSPLRKHVFIANGEECSLSDTSPSFVKKVRKFFTGSTERDARYDLSKALLYVPADKKYEAEVKYENKGNPFIIVPVAIVLLGALTALALFGVPKLMEMLDSLITTFKNL
ncbi:MAG: hypothetical protein PUC29_05190 [Clostridia bacterium]|nr:hypothetical protein [Clostridia bacterium]